MLLCINNLVLVLYHGISCYKYQCRIARRVTLFGAQLFGDVAHSCAPGR